MEEQNISITKKNIEELLAAGHTVRLHPQGYSMYPLFMPGRDEAIIAPLGKRKPRRGDVVLYRREHDILVLHRIQRITKKGIYFVGDNQTEVEGPLRPNQVRGILVAFVRKGKYTRTTQPLYAVFSRIWLILRPARRPIQLAGHFLRSRIR